MKKKILLFALIAIAAVCIFAFSVSAQEVLNGGNPLITSESDAFAEGENINYVEGLANEIYFNGTSSNGKKSLSLEQRMVLKNDDGTYSTFPSAYLFDISRDGNKRAHRFQWLDVTLLNSVTGQTYGPEDLIRLEIPEGIIDIHHDDRSSNARLGMQNSSDLKASNLKYISFPASCTGTLTMGDFARGITALEEVDFSKMTAPNSFSMSSAFYGCTNLSRVTFPTTFASDGTVPSICQINEHMFRECTSLTSITLPAEINHINKYAFYQSGLESIDLSHTLVTSIQQQAFYNCTSLRTVKMPLKLNNIYAEAFRDCTALEFVDFGNNTAEAFQFSAHRTFYNCGELRAVSLPNKTQYMQNGTFALCKKLEALYIGTAMIQINGNKGDGAGDGPTFAECEKMYFVNKPFSVTKEDGTFYTVAEFEKLMPEKPEIYYFPSTLKRICGAHNTNSGFTMDENGHVKNYGAGDLAFVKCYNLNKYLVFPEGFTGVDESVRSGNDATENPEQRGDTLGTGLFHNCATQQNPITLVFMGQIHRISFDKRNGQTSYMTYMFANAANTDFDNTTIGTYIGDTYYSNQNEMYVIFCHAEGGAQKYKINFVGSDADKNVPVLTPTLQEGMGANDVHVKVTSKTTEASCTTPEGIVYYCFCGKEHSEEITADALGHKKGAIIAIEYNGARKFFEKGDITYECDVCGEEHVVEDEAGVIFKVIGYTYTEAENPSKALMQSFAVNREALKTYNENTENDLVGYGLLSTNTSVTEAFENGVAKISAVASFYDTEYDIMELKVKGLNGRSDSIGAYADVKLHCCAYILVQNGESVDSYYATEVLDDSLTGVEITVADELSADMGASYNDIYNNRNPQ